jgi:hypothetical protein
MKHVGKKTTRKLVFLGLFIVLAFVVSSCSTKPIPEKPKPDGTEEPAQNLDEQLLQMGERLPGFGGMFFDEAGTLNVYVTNLAEGLSAQALEARRAEVETALTDVFGKELLEQGAGQRQGLSIQTASTAEVKVIEGQYDIAKLAQWRKNMDSSLALTGVILSDLDEANNRVRIGIAAGTSRAPIEKALTEKGIPLEAVTIEEVEPFSFAAHTVRDKIRPVVGGIQINFRDLANRSLLCTQGFNAFRFGTSGFITNSHCTAVQGGVNFTRYHQNVELANLNFYATEIADPFLFSGGVCPAGRRCRRSDAAFARVEPFTAGQHHGRIARTLVWTGSITINHNSPEFQIVSETPFPTVGMILDKVGRTTGWTFGRVSASCVNVNVLNTNITMLCQDIVDRTSGTNMITNLGDSGSPVFRWFGANTVSLAGVLWGGNQTGTQWVFSAMSRIESELGPLTTF